jgi:hypothetical protein
VSATIRLIERIRAEYAAMPGLKLTREQACRLWGVSHDTCEAALRVLTAEGLLHQTAGGKYVALPRPGGASLSADARPSSSLRCPHCGKRNQVDRAEATIGHGLSVTIRCTGCRRIIAFTELTA